MIKIKSPVAKGVGPIPLPKFNVVVPGPGEEAAAGEAVTEDAPAAEGEEPAEG